MTLRGGLRDRMIFKSVMDAIVGELTSIGWFDSGRQHRSINVVDSFPEGEVKMNTIAFSQQIGWGDPLELGSKAEDHVAAMFVDFFAESDSLGQHLIGDVYAFLREMPILSVYDYREDEPRTPAFSVEVQDDVEVRKPTSAANRWQKNWYVCAFGVEDYRSNVRALASSASHGADLVLE